MYKKLPVISLALGLLAAQVSGALVLAAPGNQAPASLHAQAEVAGSVVITKNPEAVLDSAEDKDIAASEVSNSFGNDQSKSIVTLDANPDSPDVKALEQQLDVEAKPNYVYKSLFDPDDTNYSSQWNLTKVSAADAWDVTRGDNGVVVAVIDTGVLFEQTIDGVTYTQPDFPTSRMWTNAGESGNTQSGDDCWTGTPEDKQTNDCDDDDNGQIDDWRGWDFMGGWRGTDESCPNHNDAITYQNDSDPDYVDQDNDPQPYSCDSPSSPSTLNKNHYNGTCTAFTSACYVGHGTMVASVIAAESDNAALVAGIDHNAEIMNLRVLDGYGFTTTALIAASVNYAVENGADVINMSLGSNCEDESFTDNVLETELAAASSAGVITVAASGNDGIDSICYPASSSHVISVGATNSSDSRLSYSNYSNKLDVVAPAGVPVANAPSAYINNNYYSNAHGTSFSTPHVAGLASLIKAMDPDISYSATRTLIRDRADKVSGMGGRIFHPMYGYGRINLHTSLEVLNGQLPVYRLYSKASTNHFYTTSVSSRNKAVTALGYKYEGIGFWSSSNPSGTIPVYRLYHPTAKNHFYTTSASSRNKAITRMGFRDEGIGFYLLDDSPPATEPIYRLYHPGVKNHFYTSSSAARAKAITRMGFRDEGIGFYADVVN